MHSHNPWQDLVSVQSWYRPSLAFLNRLESIEPDKAIEQKNDLLLLQGKSLQNGASLGITLQEILSEDWLSEYHREFLLPGNWDAQLIQSTAAGLVQHSEIDARTYRVPPSDCWVIGLSSGLLPTLRFVASSVLSATASSEHAGASTIHFDVSQPALDDASMTLGRCLGGILELGYPIPPRCPKPHVERLSLTLAVLGSRFVYQHELSHLLLKHEKSLAIPDDSSFIQYAVRNHADEFGADRSALALISLGHRASDEDLSLAYCGASFFLQVLQWLDNFRDRNPDTHPAPGARLDRLRLIAPEILDSTRSHGYQAARSLETNLHRLFIQVQDQLASDTRRIVSPVNEAVERLSRPDAPPTTEAINQFVGRVAWWLTLGNPQRVMISLGQLKADAKLTDDIGCQGLVGGIEAFLVDCQDDAALRALDLLHSAERDRLASSGPN